MTFSTSSFACAVCGSDAVMSCGSCSGFLYCGKECLGSHWDRLGHDKACARIKGDVDATEVCRVAHDVDKLDWWHAAVVEVDEGRATSCDVLSSCHGKGAFRRECGCFRNQKFGTLQLDETDAGEFEGFADVEDASRKESGNTPGTSSTDISSFATWPEVYASLGLPTSSKAALVLSTAATIAHAANELGVYTQTVGGCDAQSENLPFIVHVLGAEKELDQADALRWFLSRTLLKGLERDIDVHLFGPEVPEGWRFSGNGDSPLAIDSDQEFDPYDLYAEPEYIRIPRVTVYAHKGLYHDVMDDTSDKKLYPPSLVVCTDAGLCVFPSWVRTIKKIIIDGIPAHVTDLTHEAARMASKMWEDIVAEVEEERTNDAHTESSKKYNQLGHSTGVALNPFRNLISARGNDTTVPTYRNGFGFAWVPAVGK